MSKGDAIEAAIRERFVATELPPGALTDLGAEFGVTKQYVGQIAARMGKTSPRGARIGREGAHSKKHRDAIRRAARVTHKDTYIAARKRAAATRAGRQLPYWLRFQQPVDPLHDEVQEWLRTKLCVRCRQPTIELRNINAKEQEGSARCSSCLLRYQWFTDEAGARILWYRKNSDGKVVPNLMATSDYPHLPSDEELEVICGHCQMHPNNGHVVEGVTGSDAGGMHVFVKINPKDEEQLRELWERFTPNKTFRFPLMFSLWLRAHDERIAREAVAASLVTAND